MAEFTINIAPEKEALVKELVVQLGGSVVADGKKKRVITKKMKNRQVIGEGKQLLINDIKEAVDELKLVRAGKKKVRDAEEFLNEL